MCLYAYRPICLYLYAYSGKFLEDLRRHKRVEIVKTERRFYRLVADPSFQSGQILSDRLFICKRGKSKVILNRPIFLGKHQSISLPFALSFYPLTQIIHFCVVGVLKRKKKD